MLRRPESSASLERTPVSLTDSGLRTFSCVRSYRVSSTITLVFTAINLLWTFCPSAQNKVSSKFGLGVKKKLPKNRLSEHSIFNLIRMHYFTIQGRGRYPNNILRSVVLRTRFELATYQPRRRSLKTKHRVC